MTSTGTILFLTGKTGYRKVRILGNSVSYLGELQNANPEINKEESWFFCGIESENRGKQLGHPNVYKFLRKALKEAKDREKNLSLNLFRHTRVTMLAFRVTEGQLEAQR